MGSNTKHDESNGEDDLEEMHLKKAKLLRKAIYPCHVVLAMRKQNWAIISWNKKSRECSPHWIKDVSWSESSAYAECTLLILSLFCTIHISISKSSKILFILCLLCLFSYISSFVTGVFNNGLVLAVNRIHLINAPFYIFSQYTFIQASRKMLLKCFLNQLE